MSSVECLIRFCGNDRQDLEDLQVVLGAFAASGRHSQGVHQMRVFAVVLAPVVGCLDGVACHYAEVEYEFAEAGIDFVGTGDLEGLH